MCASIAMTFDCFCNEKETNNLPPITYRIPAITDTIFLALLQCPKKHVITPAVSISRLMSGNIVDLLIDTEKTEEKFQSVSTESCQRHWIYRTSFVSAPWMQLDCFFFSAGPVNRIRCRCSHSRPSTCSFLKCFDFEILHREIVWQIIQSTSSVIILLWTLKQSKIYVCGCAVQVKWFFSGGVP